MNWQAYHSVTQLSPSLFVFIHPGVGYFSAPKIALYFCTHLHKFPANSRPGGSITWGKADMEKAAGNTKMFIPGLFV